MNKLSRIFKKLFLRLFIAILALVIIAIYTLYMYYGENVKIDK